MDETSAWYASYRSPLGPIYAVKTSGGLTDISIRPEWTAFLETLRIRHGRDAVEDERDFVDIFGLFDSYFAGEVVSFDMPLAPAGTAFELDVWTALRKIPWGATASYGQVAAMIGRPKAARAVGAACGANPLPLIIPCHRVVKADGRIGGYSGGGGVDFKRSLLLLEGIAPLP